MRTEIKDRGYFERYSAEIEMIITRSKMWLSEGSIAQERIKIVKDDIRSQYLKLAILKYSAGFPFETIKEAVNNVLNNVDSDWAGQWKLNHKGKEYDQYILSAYDEMLWMLSLGYLVDVSNEAFGKLVNLIDRDQVKDFLFEFIIRTKVADRPILSAESYRDFFGVPKVFEKLRQAISEADKSKSEKLIHDFISKDWYKNHKDAGWYNAHKSKHDVFYGYWSFETAAVVKIMSLDETKFIDCQYYPKDLVK
ncbi:MAG: PoNe immunity protein domain-containing protein [Cyclobacteriaceae bacterium]